MSNIKEKETFFPKFKSFTLSAKEKNEFRTEAAKIDKKTEEARQLLEKALPFASEETLKVRIK